MSPPEWWDGPATAIGNPYPDVLAKTYYDAYSKDLGFESYEDFADSLLASDDPQVIEDMSSHLHGDRFKHLEKADFDERTGMILFRENIQPDGFLESAMDSFNYSLFKGNPRMYGKTAEAIGVLTRSGTLEDVGMELSRWAEGLDIGKAPTISLEDVDTQNFMQWLGESMGSGIGSTVLPMIGGMAGGAVGTAVGGPGLGTAVGGLVGAAVAASPLNMGEIYEQLVREKVPKEDAALAALITNIPVTALDAIGIERLMRAVPGSSALKKALGQRISQIVAGGIQGAATEGVTEGAQSAIRETVAASLTGNPDVRNRILSVLNEAAVGAVTGGALGSGRGAVSPAAQEEPTPTPPGETVVQGTAPTVETDPAADMEFVKRRGEEQPDQQVDDADRSVESLVLEEEQNLGKRKVIDPTTVKVGDRVVVDELTGEPEEGVVTEATDNLVRVQNDAGSPIAVYVPGVEQGVKLYEVIPDQGALEEERQQESDLNQWRDETERAMGRLDDNPDDTVSIDALKKLRNDKRFSELDPEDRNTVDDYLLMMSKREEAVEAKNKAATKEPGTPERQVLEDVGKRADDLVGKMEERMKAFDRGPETPAVAVDETADLEAQELLRAPDERQETVSPEKQEVTKKPTRRAQPKQPARPQEKPRLLKPTIGTAKGAENLPAPGKIVTSEGTEHPIRYMIVPAKRLVASHDPEGRENAMYPQELQPRDRSRKSSQLQVQRIAAKPNPLLLGESPTAQDGAPIIDMYGIVESGNARAIGLKMAYEKGTIEPYTAWLEEQGYPLENVVDPVLVRVRQDELSTGERAAFTRQANQASILGVSRTEQAFMDASAMPEGLVTQHEGGDLSLARNREFVRDFVQAVVPQNQRTQFAATGGELTAEGRSRMEAALLAKAFGSEPLVERLSESVEQGRASVKNAMLSVAPRWARMRERASDGTLHADVDITEALVDAVNVLARNEKTGDPVEELITAGMFPEKEPELHGERGDRMRGMLDLFYQDPKPGGYRRLRAAAKIAASLDDYITEAQGFDPTAPDMFEGDRTPEPGAMLARRRAQNEESRDDIVDESVDQESGGREGPGSQEVAVAPGPETAGPRQGQREQRGQETAERAAHDPQVIQELEAVVQRMAPGVRFESVPRIRNRQGQFVSGRFSPDAAAGVISVALNGKLPPHYTARHEIIHALRNAGLFTRAEWKALRRAAVKAKWLDEYFIRERYPEYFDGDTPTDAAFEESIADAFSFWALDSRNHPVGVARAFARIRSFFQRLIQALRNLEYPVDPNNIFENVDSGIVGSRGWWDARTVRAQTASSKDSRALPAFWSKLQDSVNQKGPGRASLRDWAKFIKSPKTGIKQTEIDDISFGGLIDMLEWDGGIKSREAVKVHKAMSVISTSLGHGSVNLNDPIRKDVMLAYLRNAQPKIEIIEYQSRESHAQKARYGEWEKVLVPDKSSDSIIGKASFGVPGSSAEAGPEFHEIRMVKPPEGGYRYPSVRQEIFKFAAAGVNTYQITSYDSPSQQLGYEVNSANNLEEARQIANAHVKRLYGYADPGLDSTSWEDYVHPGEKEGYREVLVSSPKGFRSFATQSTEHWEGQQDVIVHMRVDTRVLDGKKTLFVEEIQSDIHQAAAKAAKSYKETKSGIVDLPVPPDDPNFTGLRATEITEENAPMVKQPGPYTGTSNWTLLAFKQAMEIATLDGHEAIAWAYGEPQAVMEKGQYASEKDKVGFSRFHDLLMPNVLEKYFRQQGWKYDRRDGEIGETLFEWNREFFTQDQMVDFLAGEEQGMRKAKEDWPDPSQTQEQADAEIAKRLAGIRADFKEQPESRIHILALPENIRQEIRASGQPKYSKDNSDTPPALEDPVSEKRLRQAESGIQDATLTSRVVEALGQMGRKFTHRYINVDKTPENAEVIQRMLNLESQSQTAQDRIANTFKRVVSGLSDGQLRTLTRYFVFRDLLWTANQGMELPFGLPDVDAVAMELRKVQARIASDPELTKRADVRQQELDRLKKEMVRHGVLTDRQARNPHYFRHQVLAYAKIRKMGQAGKKVSSAYWQSRRGSDKDINANYIQAEAEWMFKALNDIATMKFLNWLKDSKYDQKGQYVRKARAQNSGNLASVLLEDPDKEAAYNELNKRMAISMTRLSSQIRDASARELAKVPEELKVQVNKLMERKRPIDDGTPVFGAVAWFANQSETPGLQNAARALLGSVNKRKTWIREVGIPDVYVEPTNTKALLRHFGQDGQAIWQPDSFDGKTRAVHIFTGKSIPDHVADRMIDTLTDTWEKVMGGQDPQIDPEEFARFVHSIRDARMLGGPKHEMIIDDSLAETLNEFHDKDVANGFDWLTRTITSRWRQWILFQPRRFAKYILNNRTGDLDALLGNPSAVGAMKYMGTAWADLRRFYGDEKPSELLLEALDKGVVQTGLTMQEIQSAGEVSNSPSGDLSIAAFKDSALPIRAARKYFEKVRNATRLLENSVRFAAYIHYRNRLVDEGKSVDEIGYGATPQWVLQGLSDPLDIAAVMARDALGDYGNLSVMGEWSRKRFMAFPSWLETNTVRYVHLFKNAWLYSRDQSVAGGVGKGMAATGAIAARTGLKAATMYAKIGIFYAVVQAWNNMFFGDEEEQMSAEERIRMHLHVGKWGDEIYTIRFQGALSDFLGWIGMEEVGAVMAEVHSGRASLQDVLISMAKAPVNRIAQGVNPVFKVPFELGLGRQFYPDVFKPRSIRDSWRHTFRTFSLENEYAELAKALGKAVPTRGYGHSALKLLFYSRSPGEMAYDGFRNRAYEWLSNLKGRDVPARTDARSLVLHNYKKAVRYRDKRAIEISRTAMREHKLFGRSLKMSKRRAHPLGMLSKRERREFLKTLSPREHDQLKRANRWYSQTYWGK